MGFETVFLVIAIIALSIALSHCSFIVYIQDVWKAAGGDPTYDPDGTELIDMLEELDKDRNEVAKVAYQLILDHPAGEYRLPAGWRIVAAKDQP